MSYIHYKLNMLGLILTTTSLPPPVWTHNHCLFKLVLRCFLSARTMVASPFIDFIGAFSSFVGGDLHMKSRIRSIAIFFVQIKSIPSFGSYFFVRSIATFCAPWYSFCYFVSLLEQLLCFHLSSFFDFQCPINLWYPWFLHQVILAKFINFSLLGGLRSLWLISGLVSFLLIESFLWPSCFFSLA